MVQIGARDVEVELGLISESAQEIYEAGVHDDESGDRVWLGRKEDLLTVAYQSGQV